MLIVSKFHDYYDTASIHGVDKTCVYLRNEEKMEIHGRGWNSEPYILLKDGTRFPLGKVASYETKRYVSADYEFKKAILGFCGEIYPLIKVIKTYNGYPAPSPETYCFYDQPSFANFIAEEGIVSKKYRYGSWGRERFDLDSDQGINNFFDHNRWTKLEGLFAAYHVPCWVLRERSLKLNPNLKDLGFMKIKDPQTAFQDIYMYMSGVLGQPIKPTKPIDDKIMAASKGHDGPYSFRKPPGKRGKNRWR
jgi:hypothetical protein